MQSFLTGYWIQRAGRLIAAAAAVWTAAVLPATAVTYYVATNGSDAAGTAGTAWETAFRTISNAVAKAQTNALNHVVVSNGVYPMTAYVLVTNGISIRAFSANPADTLVDGQGTIRPFYMLHTNALLSGFTISNGYDLSYGGGIFLRQGTVSNCVVTHCTSPAGGGVLMWSGSTLTHSEIIHNYCPSASGGGGGVNLSQSGCLVASCRIAFNVSTNNGGGVNIESGGTVIDCEIHDNSATNYGGGIYVRAGNGVVIRNCRIDRNQAVALRGGGVALQATVGATLLENSAISSNAAPRGGGVYIVGAYGQVRNCRVSYNTALTHPAEGGGMYLDNGLVDNCTIVSNRAYSPITFGGTGGVHNRGTGAAYSGGKLRNTIVYYNTATANSNYFNDNGGGSITNCCLAPTNIYGSANTSAEPVFIDRDAGDFRLQKSSPCINTGLIQAWMAGAQDLDGRRRVDLFSGMVDMGCYEYVPVGTMFGFR